MTEYYFTLSEKIMELGNLLAISMFFQQQLIPDKVLATVLGILFLVSLYALAQIIIHKHIRKGDT